MSNRAPIFPIPPAPPQHYSDYGFDPQIDYFQVLEEARRYGKRKDGQRAVDSLHFKLQKPISKEDRSKSKKRRQWWKNAFGIFRRSGRGTSVAVSVSSPVKVSASAAPWYCGRNLMQSGPLYVAESLSGASTPCRSDRAGSGPLRAAEFAEAGVPYLSLRDLNLLETRPLSTGEAPVKPIYLVT
ncbi:hypothetical protein KSP40_PGU008354 [Platanthera guangdongensis]|uniref:Uncharacterized protein n=1 Tax=Platanthera guangdongensis TaxID=2320717 RepID=A0ABR2MA88_9ASPA